MEKVQNPSDFECYHRQKPLYPTRYSPFKYPIKQKSFAATFLIFFDIRIFFTFV
jgi:hypothetical protein